MDIRETDSKYVAATYSRFPLTVTGGHGSVLVGDDGRKYIDLGTGIAVNTFGMCDGEWVEAVKKQLDTCGHTSNLYYTEPCAVLAKMLCERTGMKKVFFSNSGAEANECAIKAARRFAFRKYGDESRSTVITLKNSFHGRTVTTLAATGQDAFHTEFGPFTGGFVYAEAGDLDGLEALCKQGCCAVMFECVQGEGGVNALDADFVHGIFGLCEKYGILTIADEVQCGNGRSGKLYAYMNYGVTPDIVTTAKGLAGGLPLGATMFGERAADIYTPGSHGSTFGGNSPPFGDNTLAPCGKAGFREHIRYGTHARNRDREKRGGCDNVLPRARSSRAFGEKQGQTSSRAEYSRGSSPPRS